MQYLFAATSGTPSIYDINNGCQLYNCTTVQFWLNTVLTDPTPSHRAEKSFHRDQKIDMKEYKKKITINYHVDQVMIFFNAYLVNKQTKNKLAHANIAYIYINKTFFPLGARLVSESTRIGSKQTTQIG